MASNGSERRVVIFFPFLDRSVSLFLGPRPAKLRSEEADEARHFPTPTAEFDEEQQSHQEFLAASVQETTAPTNLSSRSLGNC